MIGGDTQISYEKRVEALGLEKIELGSIPYENKEKVIEAMEELYKENPELRGFLQKLEISDALNSNSYACAGYCAKGGKLGTQILLNSKYFSDCNFDRLLEEDKEEGWLAGEGIKAVIKHEFGHIVQLKMDCDESGLNIGDTNEDTLQRMEQSWETNSVTRSICLSALSELNMAHEDIEGNLSRYASKDYGECFAEAYSEYYTCENPRPLANTIIKKYKNYIRERNTMIC